MQVPGRSAVLVAVLALVSLLLAGCGGSDGSGGEAARTRAHGLLVVDDTDAAPSPSPSTSPEDALEAQVDDALAGLDRRAQIAQLFVIGVRLDALDAGDALVDDGVGGVFLAGRSQAPVEDIAAVTGRWQAASPRPRPVGGRRPGGRRRPDAPGPGVRPAALRSRPGRAARRPARRACRGHGDGAAQRRRQPRPRPRRRTSSRRAPRRATSRSASSAASTAAPRRP